MSSPASSDFLIAGHVTACPVVPSHVSVVRMPTCVGARNRRCEQPGRVPSRKPTTTTSLLVHVIAV